jgi:hypothetical protein
MIRTFKILLPVIPLAAIAVAVSTTGHSAVVHDQSGSSEKPTTEAQAPAVDVTVNGQPIDVPPSGVVKVNTGSGSASINVKNGEVKTQVTNSNNSDLHISVSTSSSGDNSNSSSFTTTNGFTQTSNNSSVQFDSFSSVNNNNN